MHLRDTFSDASFLFPFRSKKFSEMPLSTVPYKLSITYIHLFLSRYQYPVFTHSYQHLQALSTEKKKALTEKSGAPAYLHFLLSYLIDKELCFSSLTGEWPGLEVSRIHEGGNAAMVITLFSLGRARLRFEIPEQVIIFDPKLKV